MTRGRDTNTAYLYERIAGEGDHEHAQPTPGVHVARRGTGRDAAHLVRGIIANHDEQARTAHDIAAETADREQLPDRVRGLLDRRAHAVRARQRAYRNWMTQIHEQAPSGSAGSAGTSAAAKTRPRLRHRPLTGDCMVPSVSGAVTSCAGVPRILRFHGVASS